MAKYLLTALVIFSGFRNSYASTETTCRKSIELTILVDTSSNLEPGPKSDVTWVAMTAFMTRVLDALHVVSNRSTSYVITYSDDVTELYYLQDLKDKSELIETLQFTPNFSGRADVIKAIRHVHNFVKADDNEHLTNQDDVIPVLIVLSNEKSMNYTSNIQQKHELIHQKQMFVIGASQEADENFLHWLSAPPHERKKQWWPLPNYDFLSFFTDVFLPSACKEIETTTVLHTETPTCPEGRFGIDCSGFCHCEGNAQCDRETGNCPPATDCEYGWTGYPECQDYVGKGPEGLKTKASRIYNVIAVVVPCVVVVFMLTVVIIVVLLCQRWQKDKQTGLKWDVDEDNKDREPRYVNVGTAHTIYETNIRGGVNNNINGSLNGSTNVNMSSNVSMHSSVNMGIFDNNMVNEVLNNSQLFHKSLETLQNSSFGSPGTLKRNKHSPLPPVPTLQRGKMTMSNLSLKFRHDSTSTVETDISNTPHLLSLSASNLIASSENLTNKAKFDPSDFLQAKRCNGLIIVKGQRGIPSRLQPRVQTTSVDTDSETEYVEIRDTMKNINTTAVLPNSTYPASDTASRTNQNPYFDMVSNLNQQQSLLPNHNFQNNYHSHLYDDAAHDPHHIYDVTPSVYSTSSIEDDVFDTAMIYNASTCTNPSVQEYPYKRFNPHFTELTGPYEVDFDTLDANRRFSINSLPNHLERTWLR